MSTDSTAHFPQPEASLRLVVTGSSGFVGRSLVGHLERNGHEVIGISRDGEAQAGGRLIHVSGYLDTVLLSRLFDGADVVVHLAARAHVLKEIDSSPQTAYREANVDSAVAVARAARTAKVGRVVLVSSIGVNGNSTNGRPFTEVDAPRPIEPYAVSKAEAEIQVAQVLSGGPTSLVILRPTLVYGPTCPGNFRQLLNLVHRLPLVPLGGLHRRRSLIHVDNLCSAIMHAAFHPAAAGRTFVLSDGEDLSVAEVAHTLNLAFGRAAARVVTVPESLLRFAAACVGRGAAFDKLAGELMVDSSAFRLATGWLPPLRPAQALAQTARTFAANASSR